MSSDGMENVQEFHRRIRSLRTTSIGSHIKPINQFENHLTNLSAPAILIS